MKKKNKNKKYYNVKSKYLFCLFYIIFLLYPISIYSQLATQPFNNNYINSNNEIYTLLENYNTKYAPMHIPLLEYLIQTTISRTAFRFVKFSSAPSSPNEADVYENTTSHTFNFYNGTSWLSGTTGSGTANRVALWNGTNSLNGDTGFTFSGTGSSFTLTNSGKYLAGDGTAAVPSFSFGTRLGTGFWIDSSLGGQDAYLVAVTQGANTFSVRSGFGVSLINTNLNFCTALGTCDLFLQRDAANILALRNSTNAQRLNVANTFTSTSNREDLSFYFSSNIAHIGTTTTGATARALQIDYGGTTTSAISIPITSGTITFGGVVFAPSIQLNTTTEVIDNASSKIRFTVGSNGHMVISTTGANLASEDQLSWSSDANPVNAADTGLSRSSSAVVKITNGSSGTGNLLALNSLSTYDSSGTQQTLSHIVEDTVTLSGGTATVTLSGSAVFTGTSNYQCTASYNNAAGGPQIIKNSGSSITFNGTTTFTIFYICIGN